jgi:hypothetical protein
MSATIVPDAPARRRAKRRGVRPPVEAEKEFIAGGVSGEQCNESWRHCILSRTNAVKRRHTGGLAPRRFFSCSALEAYSIQDYNSMF